MQRRENTNGQLFRLGKRVKRTRLNTAKWPVGAVVRPLLLFPNFGMDTWHVKCGQLTNI